MKDHLGTILTTIRDDSAVAALVGLKVSTVSETPPSIRLTKGVTNLAPFGPNSGRVGMVGVDILAFCYGPPNEPTGGITAFEIAGAVSDALHGAGPIYGSSFHLRVWTPEIGELLLDPDTDWPYHVVRITTYAAAQAVTP